MSDGPTTIGDIDPDSWVAIIECDVCGEKGTMTSTHRPRQTQIWDCPACGREDALHSVVIASDRSESIPDDPEVKA